ncbi:MAG: hypothetical protein P3A28_02755 [Gemmatimonadota bacterium]|nr:hypothetical protein [Gemmatimonadota bacterium]
MPPPIPQPAGGPAMPGAAPAVPMATAPQGTLDRGSVGLTAIIGPLFIAVVLVLLAGFGGRLANFIYLAAAVLAGTVLYVRAPTGYVGFTLWLWFVTPFVRRVIDMHHGWSPASPILIAPPAVALLSFFTILRRLGELRGVLYAPYLLVLLALAYGYSVGVINAGLVPATYALVTWLAPALFGLHVALNWRLYPQLGAAVRQTFVWAVPILATYGIYQFMRLPTWDAQWMLNADMKSIGAPSPFLVRAFGTLNTPGPFAAFLCAGALMLLPSKGRLRFLSIGVALISLLLARTRAVWVAFLIGLIVQQLGQPLRKMPRYVITLFAVAIIAIPVVSMPRFSATIAPRLRSFTNLSQDNSFVKRYNFSEQAASSIVETAEGQGLGMTGGAIKLRGMRGVRSLDNGFLEVFYIYGWPGGGLFFLGIAGLMLQSARFRETRSDSFANATRATSIALVSILPIGDVFTGPTGTLLWMSVGFGIAGHAYHLTTGHALRSEAWRAFVMARTAPPTPPAPPDASAGAPAPRGVPPTTPALAATARPIRA